MGMCGSIKLCIPTPLDNRDHAIAATMRWLDVARASDITLFRVPDNSWKSYCNDREGELRMHQAYTHTVVNDALQNLYEEDRDARDEEFRMGPISMSEICAAASSVAWMLVGLPSSERVVQLAAAIERCLSRDVRDDFAIQSVSLWIGPHDVFDNVEFEDERGYFARSHFSVSFFGSGCPRRIKTCREMIAQLPLVRQYRKELEEALGAPVEVFSTWRH